MKRLLLLLPLVLLLSVRPASAQLANAQGWCEAGAQTVTTSGLVSTTFVQGSFPSCTISVSIHGGGTATIFSTGSSTPLSNPFTAGSNGRWIFYAANGEYDITMTGGGLVSPVVYSDVFIETGGGGGSGPTLETNGTPNASQTVLNLTNGGSTTITSGAAGLVTVASPTFVSSCPSSTIGGVAYNNGTNNTLTCDANLTWDQVNQILSELCPPSLTAACDQPSMSGTVTGTIGDQSALESFISITIDSPNSTDDEESAVGGTASGTGSGTFTRAIDGVSGEAAYHGTGTTAALVAIKALPNVNDGGGTATAVYSVYASDQSNVGITNYDVFAAEAIAGSNPAIQFGGVEGVAPAGVSLVDTLYADAVAHRWKMNNNGGGAVQVVASGADINTSDQVTVTHLAAALPINQGGTATTSTLTGIVRGGNPLTASELSGDATTSSSNVVTVVATHLASALPVNQGGTAQTVASTFPSTAGAIPTMFSCAAATACANTALGNTARVIFGSCPFSSSTTCTVTAITAFTGTSSYFCLVTEASNTGVTFKVANVSSSSFTITASGSNSDTVNYACFGN